MALFATISADTDTLTQRDKPNSNLGAMSYQCIATGLDASDGVIKLQYSNDGDTWADVPNLTQTLASGASDTHFNITAIDHKFYRLHYTANSNTAGSITVYVSH